ncbi:hypothetical protein HMPREF9999_01173 [Alloprevotella sp. oral taxon 473 str. F0040]|nr:hypothetical protein HMPREF9999_01173 [Alloprevotella sp. oral taxon 473 str. F0040]
MHPLCTYITLILWCSRHKIVILLLTSLYIRQSICNNRPI